MPFTCIIPIYIYIHTRVCEILGTKTIMILRDCTNTQNGELLAGNECKRILFDINMVDPAEKQVLFVVLPLLISAALL